MPQIIVILNPEAISLIPPTMFEYLRVQLVDAVETAFKLKGKNDAAFDIISTLYTWNESPIQIEVKYTAGGDEYKTGTIFNPDEKMRNRAVEKILHRFARFQKRCKISLPEPSVWIRPQHGSTFKPGCVA